MKTWSSPLISHVAEIVQSRQPVALQMFYASTFPTYTINSPELQKLLIKILGRHQSTYPQAFGGQDKFHYA